jgi:hypothetical protein
VSIGKVRFPVCIFPFFFSGYGWCCNWVALLVSYTLSKKMPQFAVMVHFE